MMLYEISNIEDDFKLLVDSVRDSGDITDIQISIEGGSKIITDNKLRPFEIVKLYTSLGAIQEVKVLSATNTDFNIKETVTDKVRWTACAPYFMDGHMLEIANKLTEKKTVEFRYKKYPLIILFQDFKMEEGQVKGEVILNIAIVNNTKINYDTQQRRDNNFTPILNPLYDKFVDKLNYSRRFNVESDPDVTRRYYWGSHLNPSVQKTGDPLDAIEIENLRLSYFKNNNTNCKI